jgi:hypothetical protein
MNPKTSASIDCALQTDGSKSSTKTPARHDSKQSETEREGPQRVLPQTTGGSELVMRFEVITS